MRLGTIFGTMAVLMLLLRGGVFFTPPRPRLSLQTPAPDRVKSANDSDTLKAGANVTLVEQEKLIYSLTSLVSY